MALLVVDVNTESFVLLELIGEVGIHLGVQLCFCARGDDLRNQGLDVFVRENIGEVVLQKGR